MLCSRRQHSEMELVSHSEHFQVKSYLDSLDRVLVNLADHASIRNSDQLECWSQLEEEPSIEKIVSLYAPVGLERQFQDLYQILRPSLVKHESNASAFLQGSSGSGKTLLVNQCIAALRDELKLTGRSTFRMVRINGVIVDGNDDSLVAREILQQLTASVAEGSALQGLDETDTSISNNNEIGGAPTKRRRRTPYTSFEDFLRLKRKTFSSNLQLLNEILKVACSDGIPVVFLLDELDAFLMTPASSRTPETGSRTTDFEHQNHQWLLYHLLERVATEGSLVSFVGVTRNQKTADLLEKRIRSRAEGTSQFIYVGPCPSIETLIAILKSKFKIMETDDSTVHAQTSEIADSVANMFKLNPTDNASKRQVSETLNRCFHLGKDVRWFSRVLTCALSLYRLDCVLACSEQGPTLEISSRPMFQEQYVLEALVNVGGCLSTDGASVNSRILALRTLSGPQLALVLAARRILARDLQREKSIGILTLARILEEYKSYCGGSGRHSQHILIQACKDLLELGIFRPGSDQAGNVPLQYQHSNFFYSLDENSQIGVPLQLTLDITDEVKRALDDNLIPCSAALRDWGRKTN